MNAILQEMDCSLSFESAMKNYHNIKTAYRSATKFKKNDFHPDLYIIMLYVVYIMLYVFYVMITHQIP